MTYKYTFPRPAVTATILVIFANKLRRDQSTVLIGKRQKTSNAYPGWYCLPGGFLDAGKETASQTASRELFEETGLLIPAEEFTLFGEWSGPDEDPRTHVVNLCYYVEIDNREAGCVEAGDDLESLAWIGAGSLLEKEVELAFNHAEIAKVGLNAWLNAPLRKMTPEEEAIWAEKCEAIKNKFAYMYNEPKEEKSEEDVLDLTEDLIVKEESKQESLRGEYIGLARARDRMGEK